MITGTTEHKYYCECYESGCQVDYMDWNDFLKEKEFYDQKGILFRFDIEESDENFTLQLHYAKADDIDAFSHILVEITSGDFPAVTEFLTRKYTELLEHFEGCKIPKEEYMYYTCKESKDTYLNLDFDLDYNLPFSYTWKKNPNGTMDFTLATAGQRHGRSNWIGYVKALTPEDAEKVQSVIDSKIVPYVKALWNEVM